MAWTDLTLSTTDSIARHQSNINQLSPVTSSTTQYYVMGKAGSIDGCSLVLAGLYLIDSDNNQLVLTTNLLPYRYENKTIIRMIATDLSTYRTFNFQGYNANNLDGRWFETGGVQYISLTEAKLTTETVYNNVGWQTKIDLAKQKLAQDLLVQFRSQGIIDQYNPLDLITNPTQLTITSDYLTLALIYTQLALQGLNQIYVNKRNWYWKQYQLALHNVGSVIQLSNNRITNHVGRLQI